MAEVKKETEIPQELKQLDMSLNRLHGSIDQLETSVIDVLMASPEVAQAAGDESMPMTEIGKVIRVLRGRVDDASVHVETINGRVQV